MCKECGVRRKDVMIDKDHDDYQCKFYDNGKCKLTETGNISENLKSRCTSMYDVYSESYTASTVDHKFHECPNFKLF
jgi:hypothetical protein